MDALARQLFHRELKGRADFLKIKPDSKVPVGSFKLGKRNRYKRVPKEGNYGVIPSGTLFILDLDLNKGGIIDEQIALFSDFLQVDLLTTLAVITPSGGRHYYLCLPPGELTVRDLPKTNLRSFSEDIASFGYEGVKVDADIRSEAANGYVLGPGSFIDGAPYAVIQQNKIQSIGREGFDRLASLKGLRSARVAARKPVNLWSAPKDTFTAVTDDEQPLSNMLPPMRSLRKLNQALQRNNMTYHQQRAFAKAALHCCYTNDAIVKVCIELGINKDSARNHYISRYALQRDIHSLPVSSTFHGPYCPRGVELRLQKKAYPEASWEVYLEKAKAEFEAKRAIPLDKRYRSISPRVLHYERIAKALVADSKRGSKSKQFIHAMAVMEYIFQPLANVGAEKMLAGQDFIADELGLTNSQVAQALRVLRQKGIIEICDRQKQGFAPTYKVRNEFIHRKLTYYLKRTWIEEARAGQDESLAYHPRAGGFVRVGTGDFVSSNPVTELIAAQDLAVLPPALPGVKGQVLVKYLGNSALNGV